jgi:hypothetical protein
MKVTRNNFVSRFEKWLKVVSFCNKVNHCQGQHHPRTDDPLSLLVRLYAHDRQAVKLLETKRVNPDFTSQFRTDLEFFIP